MLTFTYIGCRVSS